MLCFHYLENETLKGVGWKVIHKNVEHLWFNTKLYLAHINAKNRLKKKQAFVFAIFYIEWHHESSTEREMITFWLKNGGTMRCSGIVCDRKWKGAPLHWMPTSSRNSEQNYSVRRCRELSSVFTGSVSTGLFPEAAGVCVASTNNAGP